ncbi:MAG: GDSL-type esterase/lipase family protein [Kiritimatiellia bacterium]
MILNELRTMRLIKAAASLFLFGVWLNGVTAASQLPFPLKDGDTWVMVGDSITFQHLHSNYIEAFCFARFPSWSIHFRNAGKPSDTVPRALQRFDRDVAPWKPTIISVELGMNDHGRHPGDTYLSDLTNMTDRIRALGARPVFFTSSAVNDGTIAANRSDKNLNLDKRAASLKAFAAAQKVPFADQFHPLVDLWAANKPAEICHRWAEMITNDIHSISELPGREKLEQWLEIWAKSDMRKRGTDLGGNPIHPGPAGQLTMTATLLQGLNAPGLVSSATLDSTGAAGEAIKCNITNVVSGKDGQLSFDRLDESLPMPIPDNARGGLIIYPSIKDLSQWILKVTGLKAGSYRVNIDGVAVADVTADELAAGWNMGVLDKGPVADQCRLILQKVDDKERIVSEWRTLSAACDKQPSSSQLDALEKLNKQVLEADTEIRKAAQPKAHHFALSPVK